MKLSKKIAVILGCLFSLVAWSEAPVVDESDNFAVQESRGAKPSESPKYDTPIVDEAEQDNSFSDNLTEEGPALAKEDKPTQPPGASAHADAASLLGKVQSLQEELQTLRGQLEVQAHELKLLQQQQLAFYKDLDARLSTGPVKVGSKPLELNVANTAKPLPAKPSLAVAAVPSPSRANPADEQISYLAAYELVKAQRNEEAMLAMQGFIQKYPNGGYSGNAHYWLGELHRLKKEYQQANTQYKTVVANYPGTNVARLAATRLKSNTL
jgi:TolA-binding protein